MTIRTSLNIYACTAVALLAVSSGGNTVLGQREILLEPRTDTPWNLSLGAVQAVPADGELSSEEEGHTQLDESFNPPPGPLEKHRPILDALKDTKFEFNFRTFYLDRHKFDGAESQAWAIGGWLGLKTGYIFDHVAFAATLYTSQPLVAPDDRDGTLLLDKGQNGYTVLGELYADIRIADGYNLYVGRRGFDTPFINRNDVRMTPNTFEAIVFQGRTELGKGSTNSDQSAPAVNQNGMGLPGRSEGEEDAGKNVAAPEPAPANDVAVLKYGAGYINTIKERNDDTFVSMSVDAGAKVERGVFAAGALYEKGKFSIGAIDYFSEDIINIAYGETKMEIPLATDWKLKLAGQYTDQGSVGDNLLQGHSFSGHQFGLKAELPVRKALFTAAFTHAWGNANLQNPWSGYPGYTSVQVQDFNRAGESAFLIRAGYEFPWVEGLSAYALAVFGTEPDAAGQYRQDEYDLNLQWAPPKGFLKGLSLRLRYGIVDQHGGNVDTLTDFRTICNYVIKF